MDIGATEKADGPSPVVRDLGVQESPPPSGPSRCYKPFSIRAPTLLTLLALSFSLFALLEVACRIQRKPNPNTSGFHCPPGVLCAPNPSAWTSFSDFPKSSYFLAAYFPTLVAMMFGVCWGIVDFRIREMEPWFNLTRPGGARAEDSLCLNYMESSAVGTAVKALFRGQWAVALSSVINIVVTVLIPLAGETLVIGTVGTCSGTPTNDRCIPYMKLRRPIARLCQALLLFIATLMIAVLVLLWNRRSGIYANANSVAGLATLLGDEGMLEDLRSIDPDSSEREIERQLFKRYGFREDTTSMGDYGLAVLPNRTNNHRWPAILSLLQARLRHDLIAFRGYIRKAPLLNRREEPATRQTAIWLRKPSLVVFWFSLAGLTILILYYYIVSRDSGFERFMSSEGFGPRFMMTTVGVLIKIYWNNIERVIRTMEPYRRLLLGHAHPRDTILLPSSPHPLPAIFVSLRRLHLFPTLISLVASLAELLPVFLTSVPFNRATAYKAFTISVCLSTVVLAIMLVVLVIVLAGSVDLGAVKQAPNTVAGVAVWLCGGDLTEAFRGLATLDSRRRDRRILGMRRTYGFAEVRDRNGRIRMAIIVDGNAAA